MLLYALEQAPIEKEIIEQCVRSRRKIPDKFLNAPEVYPGLDMFYAAFMDMTSCRELGYGQIGPVNWLTVQRYCEVYGIAGEQREDMFYFVNKMDREYLNWLDKKRKRKEPK